MTLHRNPFSALALMAGLLLAAACGTKEEPAKNVPPPAPAHVPTSVAVSIAQMKFTPDTLTVGRGDTVVFTNHDVVDHDVTELPDSAWTSGPLHPGDSWKWVADSTAYYFCSIHVVMRGRVIVK
jgi:plastocyanin